MPIELDTKQYYRDNKLLKKQGIEIQYTQEQIDEYVKCSQDAVYFINKYVKIVTLDEGVVPFKLWPFQKKLIHLLHKERFVIGKLLRQVGKTSTVIAYFVWLTIFTGDLNILIAANKRQTAEDILQKFKLSYENVPVWMQQGVIEWNKGNIVLENGSKIRASSTTSGAARSGSYNIVLLDEFAHIETKLASEFYTSVYPVISSGKKTKIFMISTPKGMNLFYTFWNDAVNKKNKYVPFEVHWTDVPGRDQKWYDTTIANIGEEKFKQEFLCEFLGSSNTLISGPKLQQLVSFQQPAMTKRNEVNIHFHPIKEKWDKDEEKQLEIEHHYVMVVDTSEGKKQDYSGFVVVDITEIPYKLVATYRDNTISPLLFPSIIWNCAKYYNEAMILIETQSVGLQVADILHTELEYERLIRTFSGNKRAQQISEGHVAGAVLGVKTTRPVKDIGCMNLKTLIEKDQILIKDMDVIQELTTFVLNSKGTYEADDDANDDLVMCLVLFGWMTTQTYFKDLVNHDLRKLLKQASMDFDDQDALPEMKVTNHREVELIRIGDEFWTDSGFEASYLDPYNHYWEEWKTKL